MRILTAALLVTGLAACSRLVPPPATQGALAPQEAWARVLGRHVNELGEVDLEGLRAEPADLNRFVAWIYRTGPANAAALFPTPADRLAYHLNAYNALLLHALLHDGGDFGQGGARLRLLHLRTVQIAGEELSLAAYAERIGQLGDARVHLALHALAKGGGGLPRKPFMGPTLEADLDLLAQRFVSRLRNVQIEGASETLWVSDLFRRHAEDFLAEAPSITQWINRYRPAPLPEGYRLQYLAFDWSLNRQLSLASPTEGDLTE